jgi:Sulfatase-modifying factor enzyme 1
MLTDLHQLALYAYAATIVTALIAEFCPIRRAAVSAAVVSIALSIIAGGSWCYTVYKQGYVFAASEFAPRAAKRAPRESADQEADGQGGGSRKAAAAGDGGDGEPIPEEDGVTSGAGGGVRGAVAKANRGIQAGADALIEQFMPGRRARNAGNANHDVEGDIVRDCPSCPEMVIVAGGTQVIGASETDTAATAAERPQRQVRYWPGFAISRNPISAGDLAAFRAEMNMATPTCAGPPSHIGTESATCITPKEADRYAAWLTERSGKRFRIPSAVEWEYAARTAGVTVLAQTGAGMIAAPLDGIGRDLAEITTDCWMPYIPSPGNELRIWHATAILCRELVLKGARPSEGDAHKRFSARRPMAIDKPDWGVGFRVVRDVK